MRRLGGGGGGGGGGEGGNKKQVSAHAGGGKLFPHFMLSNSNTRDLHCYGGIERIFSLRIIPFSRYLALYVKASLVMTVAVCYTYS